MGRLDFFKGENVEDHRETVKRYLKDSGYAESPSEHSPGL